MEIIERITINCTPDKVYDTLLFFFRNSENYKLWHNDHISCYWKKGKDFSPGSILIAEEYLHGTPHRLGFRIINCNPNSILEYKMLFPFSIICSGGLFKIISKGKETELIAQLSFRFGFLLKVLFKKAIESLCNHMKEEGVSIKAIIEETHSKYKHLHTTQYKQ